MREIFASRARLAFFVFVTSVGISAGVGARPSPKRSKDTTGSISGHVYRADTGAPIPDANVDVNFSVANMVSPQPLTTITAADGSFSFTELDPGSYLVYAQAGAFFSEKINKPINLRSGENIKNADVRLDPAGVVSGTVTDENDEPVPGAYVQLFEPDGQTKSTGMGPFMADAQGHFRLPGVGPGEWYLAAGLADLSVVTMHDVPLSADSDSMTKAHTITVKPGGETAGVNLTLSMDDKSFRPESTAGGLSGSISGHVYRTDTNATVSGAIVTARIVPKGTTKPVTIWTTTGDDGKYEFSSLQPGRYIVNFRHFGFVGSASLMPYLMTVPVTVQSTPVSGIDGRLQPSSIISGDVRGPDGEPLSGRDVKIFRKIGDNTVQEAEAITDTEGSFCSAVPVNDSYYIEVDTPQVSPIGTFSYATVYYPDAESLDEAQPIVAKSGTEIPKLHLIMKRVPAVTVSIDLVAPGADADSFYQYTLREQLPSQPNIRLLPSYANSPDYQFGAANMPIRFRGVAKGTYLIEVTKANMRRGPTGRIIHVSGIQGALVASGKVTVNDSDVNVDIPVGQISSASQLKN